MATATYLTGGTPTASGYLQGTYSLVALCKPCLKSIPARAVACAAWFVYDWALSLDHEVEYIWKRKWSFAKSLYIIIRVSAFLILAAEVVLDVFLENLSSSYVLREWTLASMTAAIVFETDIVLQFRVWIMFQKSRRVLFTNLALYFVNIVATVICFMLFLDGGPFEPAPSYIQGACYGFRTKALGATLAVPLCYEVYLTLFAVYKLVSDYRLNSHIRGSSLMSTLVRDSVVYFVLIVIVMVLNIIFWDATAVTPGASSVK
ncbi:hypothetical protein EXIGLDRAFT_782474 [Exidia glandulosa HHB12029]|uniref:DUF6533 domain-containing protein n=1 Tax=Exidia glandulosa HHB12029 TaxID=1314781 RepID=A0A165ARQ6_EXIGL|nr:hypothetical protein EXIGLDRAFT_782474 [Exidia glandulosa HHB12029]